VHVEHFEGVPADQRRRGEPFQIEIKSTGQVLDVPENKSALEVLRDNGIAVDAVCEGGVCGTCRVRYVAGEPIHRDLALRVEERVHTLLVCVSRATRKLVLDL
jgi:ferredoxin